MKVPRESMDDDDCVMAKGTGATSLSFFISSTCSDQLWSELAAFKSGFKLKIAWKGCSIQRREEEGRSFSKRDAKNLRERLLFPLPETDFKGTFAPGVQSRAVKEWGDGDRASSKSGPKLARG